MGRSVITRRQAVVPSEAPTNSAVIIKAGNSRRLVMDDIIRATLLSGVAVR